MQSHVPQTKTWNNANGTMQRRYILMLRVPANFVHSKGWPADIDKVPLREKAVAVGCEHKIWEKG
jgi:hypothetical protein